MTDDKKCSDVAVKNAIDRALTVAPFFTDRSLGDEAAQPDKHRHCYVFDEPTLSYVCACGERAETPGLADFWNELSR